MENLTSYFINRYFLGTKRRREADVKETKFDFISEEVKRIKAKLEKKIGKLKIQNKGYEKRYEELLKKIVEESEKQLDLRREEVMFANMLDNEEVVIKSRVKQLETFSNELKTKHANLQEKFKSKVTELKDLENK